ncbi:MAG: hypothetical protein V1740_02240 [Candidatus Woesearchaeota archaeon]
MFKLSNSKMLSDRFQFAKKTCFYHVRARSLSGLRELYLAEIGCLHGCNGKEKVEGLNVHRGENGDPGACEGFISIEDASSGDCVHKKRVEGKLRRGQHMNEDHQNCLECQDYKEGSKKECYVDVRLALSYDEAFHDRCLRRGSYISGLGPRQDDSLLKMVAGG